MQIHIVSEGETLASIGRRYGLSVQWLQRENQLPNPENLLLGQAIVITYPNLMHTVREGETVQQIAQQYDISLRQLYRNNPLTADRELQQGENLVIDYVGPPPEDRISINGYAYPYIDRQILRRTLPFLTYLTLFTYGFDEEGGLVDIDDEEVIAIAREYGTAPIMLISTLGPDGHFSNALAHAVLNNAQAREQLIQNILRNLSEKNYYGLDIDFEYVLPEDRQPYVSFVEEVTRRCNEQGFEVIVALAPKVSREQRGLLYESHDYAALGAAANAVLLMTYEWGYTYGPPMAVSPINKVREVLDYAVTEIPGEKIFMGMPNYGYNWTLPFIMGESRARSLGNVEAIELGARYGVTIQYDEKSQAPFFYYTDDQGKAHVVWFEDARSVMAKAELVPEYGFQGIGIWNVMRWFPQSYLIYNRRFSINDVL